MLVCLAASLSMIQANLLLGMSGKTPASFAVMDLMRLPLGILSGMGFIGAGAILRKGNLVLGVTTASTLWFSTVMGLCFGGGQLALGLVALLLALIILGGLKVLETRWHQTREGILLMKGDPLNLTEITRNITAAQGTVMEWTDSSYDLNGHLRSQCCRVSWSVGDTRNPFPPSFLEPISRITGIAQVEWRPITASS